jgi:hypothetical protein
VNWVSNLSAPVPRGSLLRRQRSPCGVCSPASSPWLCTLRLRLRHRHEARGWLLKLARARRWSGRRWNRGSWWAALSFPVEFVDWFWRCRGPVKLGDLPGRCSPETAPSPCRRRVLLEVHKAAALRGSFSRPRDSGASSSSLSASSAAMDPGGVREESAQRSPGSYVCFLFSGKTLVQSVVPAVVLVCSSCIREAKQCDDVAVLATRRTVQ